MVYRVHLILLAVSACFQLAETPKFPDWPALPPQKEKAAPAVSVNSLGVEQIYVVQSDSPVQLLASPQGRVQITEETGPIRVRGKFVDGDGKVETRLYEKKQVFLVERVASGDVELLMVPKGEVTRRTVTDGTAPIPPPKPIDPKPMIEKSPWDDAPGLRVMIVYRKDKNLSADQQAIITGARVRNYLDAKCVKESGEAAYFIWKTGEDVSAVAPAWQKAYNLSANRDWIVLGNGSKWEQGPLPANADAALALLKKYE